MSSSLPSIPSNRSSSNTIKSKEEPTMTMKSSGASSSSSPSTHQSSPHPPPPPGPFTARAPRGDYLIHGGKSNPYSVYSHTSATTTSSSRARTARINGVKGSSLSLPPIRTLNKDTNAKNKKVNPQRTDKDLLDVALKDALSLLEANQQQHQTENDPVKPSEETKQLLQRLIEASGLQQQQQDDVPEIKTSAPSPKNSSEEKKQQQEDGLGPFAIAVNDNDVSPASYQQPRHEHHYHSSSAPPTLPSPPLNAHNIQKQEAVLQEQQQGNGAAAGSPILPNSSSSPLLSAVNNNNNNNNNNNQRSHSRDPSRRTSFNVAAAGAGDGHHHHHHHGSTNHNNNTATTPLNPDNARSYTSFDDSSTLSYLQPFVSRLALESFSEGDTDVVRHLECAVLFIDISGYSKITSALARQGPFAISSAVNGYLEKILEIAVGKYRADVISFAGDAVTVIFKSAMLKTKHESNFDGGDAVLDENELRELERKEQQYKEQGTSILELENNADAFPSFDVNGASNTTPEKEHQQAAKSFRISKKEQQARTIRRRKLSAAAFKAAMCSMELQKRCGTQAVQGTEHIFRLHIAVAAGDVTSTIYTNTALKSMQPCYQVMSGKTMKELAPLVDLAKSGEVCISAETLKLVNEYQQILDEKRTAAKMKLEEQQQHAKRNNNNSNNSLDDTVINNSSSESKLRQHRHRKIPEIKVTTRPIPVEQIPEGTCTNISDNAMLLDQLALYSSSSPQQKKKKSSSSRRKRRGTSSMNGDSDTSSVSGASHSSFNTSSSPRTSSHRHPNRDDHSNLGDSSSDINLLSTSSLADSGNNNLVTNDSDLYTGSFGSSEGISNMGLFSASMNSSTIGSTDNENDEDEEEDGDADDSSSSNSSSSTSDDTPSTISSSDLDDDFVSEVQRLRQDKLIHPAVARKVSAAASATQIAELRFITVLFIYRRTNSRLASLAKSNNNNNQNDDEDESAEVYTANWIAEIQDVLDSHQCPILQIADNDKGLQVIACISLFVADHKSPSRGIEVCRELEERGVPCNIGLACGSCFVGVVGHPQLGCRFDIAGAPAVRAARLMSHAIKNNYYMVCDQSIAEVADDNSALTPLGEISVKGSTEPVSIFTHTTFNPAILDALIPPKMGCVKLNVKATRKLLSFIRDKVYRRVCSKLSVQQVANDGKNNHFHLVHAAIVHGGIGTGKLTTILNALGLWSQDTCGSEKSLAEGRGGERITTSNNIQSNNNAAAAAEEQETDDKSFIRTIMVCSEKLKNTKLQIGYFVIDLVRNIKQLSSLEQDADLLEYALQHRHILRAVSLCSEIMKKIIGLGVRLAIIIRRANYLDDSSWAMIKFVMHLHTTLKTETSSSSKPSKSNNNNDDDMMTTPQKRTHSGAARNDEDMTARMISDRTMTEGDFVPASPILLQRENQAYNRNNNDDSSPTNANELVSKLHAKLGKIMFLCCVSPLMLSPTWQDIAKKLPADRTITVGIDRMTTHEVSALIEHIVGWKPMPSFVPLISEKSGGVVQCAHSLLDAIVHHRPGFEEVMLQIDCAGCYLPDDCAHHFDRVPWMQVNPQLAAKNLGDYDALATRPQLQLILRILAEATSHTVWGVSRPTLLEVVLLMQRRSKNLDNITDFNKNIYVLKQLELVREASTATPDVKQYYIGNPVLHDVLLNLTPPVQRREMAKGLALYFVPVIPCTIYDHLIRGWYLTRASEFVGAEKELEEAWRGWKELEKMGAMSEVQVVLNRYVKIFEKVMDTELAQKSDTFKKWYDYQIEDKVCNMNQSLVRGTLIPLMNMRVPIAIGHMQHVLEAAGKLIAAITFRIRAEEQPESTMMDTLAVYLQMCCSASRQILENMIIDKHDQEANEKNEKEYPLEDRRMFLQKTRDIARKIQTAIAAVKRTYCYVEEEDNGGRSNSTKIRKSPFSGMSKEEWFAIISEQYPDKWNEEIRTMGIDAVIDYARGLGIHLDGMERFEKGYHSPHGSAVFHEEDTGEHSNANNHDEDKRKQRKPSQDAAVLDDYLELEERKEFFEAEKEDVEFLKAKKKRRRSTTTTSIVDPDDDNNKQEQSNKNDIDETIRGEKSRPEKEADDLKAYLSKMCAPPPTDAEKKELNVHKDKDHNQHSFYPACPVASKESRKDIAQQWTTIAREFHKLFNKPSNEFKQFYTACETILGGKNSVCKRPQFPKHALVKDPKFRKALTRAYGQCVGARSVTADESLSLDSRGKQQQYLKDALLKNNSAASSLKVALPSVQHQENGDVPLCQLSLGQHNKSAPKCTMTAMLDERFMQKQCILKGLVPLATVNAVSLSGSFSLPELHHRLLKNSSESVESFTAMMFIDLSLGLPEGDELE